MGLLAAFTEALEEVAYLAEVADAADLTDAMDVAFFAPDTEVLEPCLGVANLAEAADVADLTDAVDVAFFAPYSEFVDAGDLMEVSETALLALPTEVVDFCSEALTGWIKEVDAAFFLSGTAEFWNG